MKQSKRLLAVLGAVCALNFIGHLICLPFLPDVIPVHWNFAGQADGWGPKETNLILAALPALMLLLLWFLPRIDPKGQNFEKFAPLWRGTMTGIVLFFCALTWVSVLAAFGDRESYAVSHVGFGMNRSARWDYLELYDKAAINGTEARAFAGNFLFSTGANENAGRYTAGHFDLPMRGCTVALDDRVVVDEGVLQGELA